MKTIDIPKGIKFSFAILSFPLALYTFNLVGSAAMVGTSVAPYELASIARTCVRLLALNLSFFVSIPITN